MFNIAIPMIPIGFIADTFQTDRLCSHRFHTDTFHTDMFCLCTLFTQERGVGGVDEPVRKLEGR